MSSSLKTNIAHFTNSSLPCQLPALTAEVSLLVVLLRHHVTSSVSREEEVVTGEIFYSWRRKTFLCGCDISVSLCLCKAGRRGSQEWRALAAQLQQTEGGGGLGLCSYSGLVFVLLSSATFQSLYTTHITFSSQHAYSSLTLCKL